MKLNLACGGDLSEKDDWINVDKFQFNGSVVLFDYDKELLSDRFGENQFDTVFCKGAFIEFEKNPIEIFSDLYKVCVNGAMITIVTSVVDNGTGSFRDPVAKHHYHSDWCQYIGGSRIAGGWGLGLRGTFEIVSNDVAGEVQTVTFKVIKHG